MKTPLHTEHGDTLDSEGNIILSNDRDAGVTQSEEEQAHIVACVNACGGMADPVSRIQWMQTEPVSRIQWMQTELDNRENIVLNQAVELKEVRTQRDELLALVKKATPWIGLLIARNGHQRVPHPNRPNNSWNEWKLSLPCVRAEPVCP
jgi:hypothetical protein